MTSDRLSLEHPSARFDLTLDARIVEDHPVRDANIILELAAGGDVTGQEHVRLELTPSAGGGGRPQSRYVELMNGATSDARTTATQGAIACASMTCSRGTWQLVFRRR